MDPREAVTSVWMVVVRECSNELLGWKPGASVCELNETFTGVPSFQLGLQVYGSRGRALVEKARRGDRFVGVSFDVVEFKRVP